VPWTSCSIRAQSAMDSGHDLRQMSICPFFFPRVPPHRVSAREGTWRQAGAYNATGTHAVFPMAHFGWAFPVCPCR